MQPFVTATLSLVLAAACTGSITGAGGEAPGAPQDHRKTGAPSSVAAPMPLRRLSRDEYANTIRDLLGRAPSADERFATETSGPSGYPEGGPVSPDELDHMLVAVESIAQRYRDERLATDLGCPIATANDACVTAFVRRFARRAYRHAPSADELADLEAVFDAARADHDAAGALTMVVEAALASPRFNYRWELGDAPASADGGVIELGPFERASRLSYFLWASMPDDVLLDAAEQGKLATSAELRAQAERLLADPRGVAGVRSFFASWSPVGTLASDGARAPLLESSLRFVDDVVMGDDHGFATLLAGDHAFVDRTTAAAMGLAGSFDATFKRVSLAGTGRAGLFTQPGFLAATASTTFATIIHRGRFVFERLGDCTPVPPPNGPIPDPPPRDPNRSVREQLAVHAAGSCASCHKLMDDAGFAFDGYDAQGATRASDDWGKPIDAAGAMTVGDATITFRDAADLLRQLATRSEPRRCFAKHLTAFALRAPAAGEDEAAAAFVSDGDVRRLLVEATTSFAFSHRRPATDEVPR